MNGLFYFGEYIVNKDEIQLKKDEKFYDLKIAENVVNLSIVMGIALIIGFSVFLIFSFNNNFKKAKIESEALIKKTKTNEEI